MIRNRTDLLDWLMRPRTGPEVLWYLNPFTLSHHRAGHFAMGGDDHVVVDGGTTARLVSTLTGQPCESLSFDYTGVAATALDRLSRQSARLGLVGGTEDEVARVTAFLSERHPGLDIVLALSGYGPVDPDLAHRAAQARPDVLLLSMGSPRQEALALSLKARLDYPTAIVTCGAFVHQTARHPYYPAFYTGRNLRWLYRALNTPHIAPRILRHYLPFLARAALRRPELPFRD
ncbi:MAG: WecB/TagA/CpsF family glycosyltransferase [Pseudomonadota bacterium]|nr:WecB/TagA/CpsF family glycosyltransferase [Pseudomonadota bacterium]